MVLPLEASPFQVVPMIQAVVACPGILVALEDLACLRALEVLAWVASELPLTLEEVQVALDESLEEQVATVACLQVEEQAAVA